MRAEICRPTELGASERALWHAYQGRVDCLGNPFLTPEFAVAADRCRHDVRLAVIHDDGRLIGFLPYSAGRGGWGRPVVPGMTDMQALVHDPSCPLDLTEVISATGLVGWSFDHLVSFQAPRTAPVRVGQSWIVELAGGSASYVRQIKASRPKNLSEWQRKTRRLEKECGPVVFHFAEGSPALLGHIIDMKRAQCHRNGWRDVLAIPWVARLLDELASSREDNLTGIISSITAGDVVVSAEFGLRSSRYYASWFSAFDIRYSNQSPGSILWLNLFQRLADNEVDYADLGKGLTEAKRRFSTGSIEVAEGVVARTDRLGRSVLRAASVCRWGRRRAPGLEVAARQAVQRARRHRYEGHGLLGETGADASDRDERS